MSWWSWEKHFLLIIWVFAIAVALIHPHLVDSCHEEERLALLHLKAHFKSHYNPSLEHTPFEKRWSDNGEIYNCCSWNRVHCNPSTGRVTELHLSSIVFNNDKVWLFNVTLFRPFTQLISLDLSSNGINGLVEHDGSTMISMPKSLLYLALDLNPLQADYVSIGALTSLRTLNLFDCGLNQSIVELGVANLTQLHVLDLGCNQLHGVIQGICELRSLQELHLQGNLLSGGVPSCLYNLTSLRFILLSYNQFNGMLPHGLSNLPLLESLQLSKNYFEGQLALSSMANLSKLQVLSLSSSGLEIQTEDLLWKPMFQLQELQLDDCNLNKPHGIIPNFLRHQNNLTLIDLSHNSLTGSLPTWLLSNNSRLGELYLTNNSLTGSLLLPNSIQPFLIKLVISSNHFQGKVPESLNFIFPNLSYFNISRNHFEGDIPTSIAQMILLESLDVSGNNFSGELPRGLFTQHSLNSLILSDNHFQGEIIPNHMNLTHLVLLKASNNSFGGTIKDSLKTSAGLTYLDISNNNIMGQLPRWIGNFWSLKVLLVSKNFLRGHIPREICQLPLRYLDLSYNNFTGLLPPCSNYSSLNNLRLNKNKFRGSIPDSFSSCSSLREMDLRDNLFSGNIPTWINKLFNLRVLQLGGNDLRGLIPYQLCNLSNLDILDLSGNHLYGGIPTCLGNMSMGQRENLPSMPLELLFHGRLNLPDLFHVQDEVEVLAKKQYYSYAGGDHLVMSALDLSSNDLSGVIPQELGELNQIQSLNLSHNYLSGCIPNSFSNLKKVESLDLSYNHLNGMIPFQLAELNFLEIFNVSFNNLSGITPETRQFATFDQSSYLGNPGLCGSSVNKSCQQNNALPPVTRKEDKGDMEAPFYMEDFLWCFGMTSFIAFFAVGVVLSINPQWRRTWFDFVEWHILWWLL